MNGLEAWVGPAIVAAVISSLITAAGWVVNYRTSIGLERRRREEKIRDFQIALRAEIRSELKNLAQYDVKQVFADMERRYAQEPEFSVWVPGMTKHVVFDALVEELHILPEGVIEFVVLYARQRQVVESLVTDMRGPAFRRLAKDRQLSIYAEYLRMWETLRVLAQQAEGAIDRQAGLNSPDEGRSAR